MLGVVFTTLIDMLEENVSPEFADEVLVEADFEHQGAYTAVGYYPFEEMVTLLTILSNKTGKTVNELLYDYGVYLFTALHKAHPQVAIDKYSVVDILKSLEDDIHVQVRKLYADADLPMFEVVDSSDKHIDLLYTSKHELYALAEGLIDGAAATFNNEIERTTEKTDKPSTYALSVKIIN